MFDKLQVLLWSITYILIIFFSYKNIAKKNMAIPFIAILLNFSWEICALYVSGGFWAHIIWFGLDLFIFIYAIICVKKKIFYLISLIGCVCVFMIIRTITTGMLISSFIIDLIMAIYFWIDRKKILRDGKIVIAVTKLFGDVFALIYYAKYSIIILICGVCVLAFNVLYLVYCVREKKSITSKL